MSFNLGRHGPIAEDEILEFEGEEIIGDPVRLVNPQSYRYLEAFNWLKSGYGWPNGGGPYDQPAKLLDAIGIIEAQVREIEKDTKARKL